MPVSNVLVVTAELDAATARRFDDERRRHFPAGRTAVGAHLTLFHAVPGSGPRRQEVVDDVSALARRPVLDVRVGAVRDLGGHGAAYDVESRELVEVHHALQERWWADLTRQDRQPLAPHVTVQNKADPTTAARTLAELRGRFQPFPARVEALAVWRYVGGPWEPVARIELGADD